MYVGGMASVYKIGCVTASLRHTEKKANFFLMNCESNSLRKKHTHALY